MQTQFKEEDYPEPQFKEIVCQLYNEEELLYFNKNDLSSYFQNKIEELNKTLSDEFTTVAAPWGGTVTYQSNHTLGSHYEGFILGKINVYQELIKELNESSK